MASCKNCGKRDWNEKDPCQACGYREIKSTELSPGYIIYCVDCGNSYFSTTLSCASDDKHNVKNITPKAPETKEGTKL